MSPLTAAETKAVLACMPKPPVTEDELSAVEKLRAALDQTPSGEEPTERIAAVIETCRGFEANEAEAAANGDPHSQATVQLAQHLRELLEQPLPQPSGEEGEGEGLREDYARLHAAVSRARAEFYGRKRFARIEHLLTAMLQNVRPPAAHPHDQEAPQVSSGESDRERADRLEVECRELEDANRSLSKMRDAALEGKLASQVSSECPHCGAEDRAHCKMKRCELPAPQVSSAWEEPLIQGQAEDKVTIEAAVYKLRRFMCCPAGRELIERELIHPFGYVAAPQPQVSSGDEVCWEEVTNRVTLLLADVIPDVEAAMSKAGRIVAQFQAEIVDLPAPSTLTDEEREKLRRCAEDLELAHAKLVDGAYEHFGPAFLRTLAGKEQR